eukprot:CAMPEP_0194186866 /NCGR_PEP_ID=MMETSP0154-20130528/48620_1 /TAXON_ID=1049557 /ORGANISM="Thalassiothrix antarctica, Strain L6-D1" /LENGTH=295 /DNA_ID=CAMNT_0038906205 /DNA_START=70 /DNA_END=953 /DNA_ORIENTATION=-
MLSSGMQESQNKVISFPDKNPEEWKLFYPFLEPRSLSTSDVVGVTKENAKAILPWFHEFGLNKLLKESDDKLWCSLLTLKRSFVPADHRSLSDRITVLEEIVGWAETADIYSLPRTRSEMVKDLKKAMTDYPELISKNLLEKMRPLWSKASDNTELWETVMSMIPKDARNNGNDEELKSNPLFLDLLSQSFKIASLRKNQTRDISQSRHSESDDDMDSRFAREGWPRLRGFRHMYETRQEIDDIRRQSLARQIARRRRVDLRRGDLLARSRHQPGGNVEDLEEIILQPNRPPADP